jgi:hypothetical protein
METKNTFYNGWTNYETWAVNLWIDNEEGSYNYWKEVAEELVKELEGDKGTSAYNLSKRLEDETKENAPSLDGVYGDLLNAALSEVNWYEIAKSMVEDVEYVKEEEEEEENKDE